MDPITGTPDNPLLTQIRQQRAMQPDTPPPSLLPPPGMDSGAPPIMQTPQPNVVDRHFNQANAAPKNTLLGQEQKRNQVLASGPGVNQVYGDITNSSFGEKHPLAGKLLGGAAQGLASLGNIALSAASPRLASLIPGTSAHHAALLSNEDKGINQMQGEQQKTAQTGEENATTANLQSEVPLHEAQASAAALTPATAEEAKAFGVPEGTQLNAASRAALAKQVGINTSKEGIAAEGNETKMSVEELKSEAAAAAQSGKPQPHIISMQHGTPHVMERDPATKEYSIDRGIAPATYAQVLPQMLQSKTTELLGDEGVQHRFQYNPKTGRYDQDMGANPTGQAAHQIFQGAAIEKLAPQIVEDINSNRKILGSLPSYYKEWTSGTPVADPAAAQLMTELMSFAAMQPALHAFRSTSALDAFEKMIGGLAKNPDATIATINGLLKTPEAFTGLPKKPGSPSTPQQPPGGAPFKVKLSDAMALPQNKGLSEAQVEADVKKHGGEVVR